MPGAEARRRGKPPVPAPASTPDAEPVDSAWPADEPVDPIWAAPSVEPDYPDSTYPLPLIEPVARGKHWSRVA
jgi:hypothetical protein